MYEHLIKNLDNEIKTITIKKRNKKILNTDLTTAVDSLLHTNEEESTAVLPTEKIKTEKVADIVDISELRRVKKDVIVEKIKKNDIPELKKKPPTVWL